MGPVSYFILILLAIYVNCDKANEDKLTELQNDFREWRIENLPEFSTRLLIYKYNDRMDSYDVGSFNDTKSKVDSYMQQLNSIAYTQLTDTSKNDYDIFKDVLQTVIDGYQWRLYTALNPINNLEGPQVDPNGFIEILPFDTVGDYENYIARLNKMPQQLTEMQDRMTEAINRGHTNHNVSMNTVSAQIEAIIQKTGTQSVFYQPFGEKLNNMTSIDPATKTSLRNRASTSITNVLAGYTQLKSFLETTYYKNLRTDLGVSSWDKGSDFYKACLKWHLSLDKTPEDVHQTGLREVERIYGEMTKIMDKLKFTGTVKQFFDSLKNDSRFYGKTKTEVFDMFNNIVHQRIEPKLPEMFKDLPNLPVIVKEMANDGPGGMYSPGSTDGSRPGQFLLNLFRPAEMLTVDFVALSLHETNPGHHLQISYAQTADIPKYRSDVMFAGTYNVPYSFPEYTAYLEGWALYAESLGEEMKIYANDYELMGRYSSEIFRACRLVVDTGLHQFNWTRDRAIEYMLNYTAYSRDDIQIEVDRYVTWPGQACAYKIGEIKIKELRSKAERELGNRFDIKDFHSTVLTQGSMSLSMLEQFVNKWIQEVKNTPQNPGGTGCINGSGNERQINFSMLILIAALTCNSVFNLDFMSAV